MRQSFKRMFRIAAVALLVACAAPAAGAQGDSEESDEFGDLLDLGQFDGIEFAVNRTWAVASITQEPVEGQLLSLSTMIAQFNSDADARDAFQPLSDIITDGYTESGIPLVESGLDDDEQPGDEAIRSVVDPEATPTDGLDGADLDLFSGLTVLSARSDATIVVVIALPLEGDADATVLGMAEAVLDREAGDDSVSLDDDGASTGGLFDRMPAADDPILTEAGVEPFSDAILYPATD